MNLITISCPYMEPCFCYLKTRPTFKCVVHMYMYRTAPLLRPPFLRPTSMKKRGEGVTTRTCTFASQLSPPLPRIRVLRSTKLCCAVEDENSFDRHAVPVLKDGRVVGHVHVAIFLQNIVSLPDSSHRPRDYTAG